MATTNQRSQEQKKGEDKGDILRNDDQRSLQRQVLGYLSPKNPIIIGGIFKTALNTPLVLDDTRSPSPVQTNRVGL